ncbi:hypothetical protein BDY17DRAFT_295535 [Neohortaea acidophila]|uniref:Uncharacterized protein n=1 Tax=Neohortaea acidophila TaxID=245834 RepID=A0A6A6PXE8_9PEZI|nr:uncharacterized protein BDY17DRAFT_295535 [Neohortaea acidophila]KAF2484379.1 hypothetical protein BDY17DRAFT_295535 [Neohortaea acidophila]
MPTTPRCHRRSSSMPVPVYLLPYKPTYSAEMARRHEAETTSVPRIAQAQRLNDGRLFPSIEEDAISTRLPSPSLSHSSNRPKWQPPTSPSPSANPPTSSACPRPTTPPSCANGRKPCAPSSPTTYCSTPGSGRRRASCRPRCTRSLPSRASCSPSCPRRCPSRSSRPTASMTCWASSRWRTSPTSTT